MFSTSVIISGALHVGEISLENTCKTSPLVYTFAFLAPLCEADLINLIIFHTLLNKQWVRLKVFGAFVTAFPLSKDLLM